MLFVGNHGKAPMKVAKAGLSQLPDFVTIKMKL
jgi:hypothetical protein